MLILKFVSLRHIKRVGLVNWKSRAWWIKRTVSIWSGEHRAWWRPNGHGYTQDMNDRWATDFETAFNHTEHCGPEKKISYCAHSIQDRTRP